MKTEKVQSSREKVHMPTTFLLRIYKTDKNPQMCLFLRVLALYFLTGDSLSPGDRTRLSGFLQAFIYVSVFLILGTRVSTLILGHII